MTWPQRLCHQSRSQNLVQSWIAEVAPRLDRDRGQCSRNRFLWSRQDRPGQQKFDNLLILGMLVPVKMWEFKKEIV